MRKKGRKGIEKRTRPIRPMMHPYARLNDGMIA